MSELYNNASDWLSDAGAVIADPPQFDGPIKMQLRAKAPDRRKRDIDNIVKPVGDLLEHFGAVTDDSLIQHLDVAWDSSVDKSSIQIVLTSLPACRK